MKIYVVTQGSYSDYHIITATTDEKLANKIAKKFGWYNYMTRVEEYDDAELYLKPVFFVRFDEQGMVTEISNRSKELNSYNWINECDFDVNGQVCVFVQAVDEGDAIKIAREKRAEFLDFWQERQV